VTPLVIAHRGASWDLPENTLSAFERAIEDGADFVELDVHAMDERLVVVHDPPRRGRSYPLLEEVIELTRGRIPAMVELKQPYRYRRHDVVRRTLALLGDDDVLTSFEAEALREAHRLRPRLRLIQHVGLGVSIAQAARYAWGAGFADGRVVPRTLDRTRARGLATVVYTVNRAERMRELADLGVTGIVTDRPGLMRAVLAQAPPQAARPG
jgi:glycerophosphoryl diester phosphodiesterase